MNNQELSDLLITIPQNRRDIKINEVLFSPIGTIRKLKKLTKAKKTLEKAIAEGYSLLNKNEMAAIDSYKKEYVR